MRQGLQRKAFLLFFLKMPERVSDRRKLTEPEQLLKNKRKLEVENPRFAKIKKPSLNILFNEGFSF